jgi:hypothetical protein
MTIEQQVVEKPRALPPEKQKEVLEFVDFLFVDLLKDKKDPKKPRRSLLGLWADLNNTSRKQTSPRAAAKCGATFRVTSTYERSAGYSCRSLVFGRLPRIVSGCPDNY